MMVVDMQVAFDLDVHVNKRMTAELIQHMVEEAHTVEIFEVPVPSIVTDTETEVSFVLREMLAVRRGAASAMACFQIGR